MNTPVDPQAFLCRQSFIELNARERANTLMDAGTARELLGPFDRLESPWLAAQGITPQADDGCVVIKGKIAGQSAVVTALDGAFQGGSMGEVSGAKMTAALELAAEDCEHGTPTSAVILLETGGVRLQEANLGLAAIAEVMNAVLVLRRHAPVICLTAGTVGCFGGMGLVAGLASYVVMTREARLGMNGAEVIQEENGIEEFDPSDRALIWAIHGGEQRHALGLVDTLVEDDVSQIASAVQALTTRAFRRRTGAPRSISIDAASSRSTPRINGIPRRFGPGGMTNRQRRKSMRDEAGIRGSLWFHTLTGQSQPIAGDPASVLVSDADLGGERARFLCVVPNPDGRFPCARHGEVGLEEAYTLAARVREITHHDGEGKKQPIIAIVDLKSQAYGRREETAAIYPAAAAAADAYGSARLAGHPVIALVVGQALSGGFYPRLPGESHPGLR